MRPNAIKTAVMSVACVLALVLSGCHEFKSPIAPLSQASNFSAIEGKWAEYGQSGTRYRDLTITKVSGAGLKGLLRADFKDPKENKEYGHVFYPVKPSGNLTGVGKGEEVQFLNVYTKSLQPSEASPASATSYYLMKAVVSADKKTFTLYELSKTPLWAAKQNNTFAAISEKDGSFTVDDTSAKISQWINRLQADDWQVYYIYRRQ